MKVGAVMPTYNQAEFLDEAIASVINQVDTLLVVDDGSTDGTASVLKKYKGRIARVSYQGNQGTAFAINYGIKHLQDYDWLAWVSSDNVYRPNWREIIEEPTDDAAGVVYSGYNWGGQAYQFTPYAPEKLISNVNCFFGPSFIIRKDVWQEHRGKISHDYDNWLRVEEACWEKGLDIIGVNDDLCYYRVHPKRVTVTRRHQFDAPRWQQEARSRREVPRV